MLLKRNTTINTLKKYLIEEIKESLKNLNFPLVKFNLTTPKNEEFGDLSTNVAMLLTKPINKKPIDIADEIKFYLLKNINDNIDNITVTPPGFINFKIKHDFYQKKIKQVISDGDNFGKPNQKNVKTAKNDPICKLMSVNRFFCDKFKNLFAIIKCEEELMGKNSVTP